MKKIFLGGISLLFSFLWATAQPGPEAPPDTMEMRILQPAAMQQDFSYLRKTLEETCPMLYKRHSREEMEHIMDSLYGLLDKPMPFFDFYKTIAHLISEVKCEHSYCNPYRNLKKHLLQWKVLPIQIEFNNQKAYMAVNRSADTSVHFGDEVLSINHYPIDSIKKVLYEYMPSDGDMVTSKDKMLSNLLFNVDYYLFIERPDAFDITFKDSSGRVFTRHFNTGLGFAESNKLALANPVNQEVLAMSARFQKVGSVRQQLELLKDQDVAIISIPDFGDDKRKLFKRFSGYFTKIAQAGVGNLIIDLSQNGGGDEEIPCELLSYLIDTPTRFMDNEYLIDTSMTYLRMSNLPKDILANPAAFIDTIRDGKIYAKPLTKYTMELRTFDPKPNRFHGKVYFYVSGITSSAASTCAANAQSHHLATIVGEETAGSFAGGGSTDGINLVLPNSKITTHTSIVYCTFATSGGDKDRGVIPDIHYEPTLTDYRNGNVSWQYFIYGLIKGQKQP